MTDFNENILNSLKGGLEEHLKKILQEGTGFGGGWQTRNLIEDFLKKISIEILSERRDKIKVMMRDSLDEFLTDEFLKKFSKTVISSSKESLLLEIETLKKDIERLEEKIEGEKE